ncbi:MAG TPA: hypothetical protein DCY13_23025 [Verrucomicrobiales bacterium]|nr:hypothetical protein [Verrucomicrobiales bacterium]
MNISPRTAGSLAALGAALCLLFAPSLALAAEKDRDDCARNLQTVWNAIQQYRGKHKDLPVQLSQLVPEFVNSPATLICPVTRRTGEIKNRGFSDPGLTTSYLYEFSGHKVPGLDDRLGVTLRDWRQLQMGRVGSIVPIVRCLHHPRVLNMSFDGKLYETADEWEAELGNVIDPVVLTPTNLVQQVQHFVTGVRAGRVVTLDLSKFYNAELASSLHEANPAGPTLAAFPKGRNRFRGIPFEVGGVIQLQGRMLSEALPDRYSTSVTGIPVNQQATQVHFLGGAGWNVQNPIVIGHFMVHYEDGESTEVPIIYGRHVVDWWNPPTPDQQEVRVAWSGTIQKSPGHEQIGRVYQYSWDNPRALVPIKSLDFVSRMAAPAPFLLGISVEQP